MKRLLDLTVVIATAPLWIPLTAMIAILVYWQMGSPVLFRQERGGYKCQIFSLCKFRTMSDLRDRNGNLLPDHERLLPLGKILRSFSLDELPGVFNLIKGDITLVGPRPFMAEYLPLYSPEQQRRHEVRPGITGWAQINGRNALSWDEKFRLDLWYVDNRSLWLDIRILWITAMAVLRRKGISQEGHATVGRFRGLP